jgi:CSLREA domain-containing protein
VLSRHAVSIVIAAVLALLPAAGATAQERVVTTTLDGNDGHCDAHCTLREAVALSTRDEVVILPAGRYELTHGELELGIAETILGDGARTTVIDAGHRSRVLRATGLDNLVSGVTITGGTSDRGGGGIRVDVHGRLALEDSSVVGNVAPRNGGGIFNAGGLRLIRSTVAGNRAGHAAGGPGRGGGIYSSASGHAALENSTISGNTARPGGIPSRGGGVFSAGDLAVNHVTVAGNSASDGGGLYESNLVRSLSNTILAGNPGGACSGRTSIGDEKGNLDDDGTCGLSAQRSFPQRDPLLVPLANNGGETDTHALGPGSPAIDAGSRASCLPQDQRHVARDAACDVGAFEVQAPVPVRLNGSPLDLFSDGAGRLQVRVEGQPGGIFAAPDDNAADAGLAIKQGGVHFGLGVGRTVISAPHVTQLGASRTMSSQYAVGPDLLVSERIEYDDGSQVVDMRYEIQSRSGGAVTFRAGALADLFIAGDDTGAGVFIAADPRFVGGRSRDGAMAGLVERTPWLNYEAGDAAGVFGNFAGDGLTNSVLSDVVDNAVGVEWQRTVEPGRPAVLQVSWRISAASQPTSDAPTAAPNAGSPQAGEAQEELPPPVAGRNVNILPVRGTVRIKLPGASEFIVLEDGRQIPVGTIVDTLNGRARLVAASDMSGGTAAADFYGGVFLLRQTKSAKPITRLKLTERLRCNGAQKAGTAASRKGRRRLWGDGSGRFRTEGRYSSATVRGTKWLVQDRCTSTLTKVTSGRVAVRDFVKRKTVIVRAGKQYVARARR